MNCTARLGGAECDGLRSERQRLLGVLKNQRHKLVMCSLGPTLGLLTLHATLICHARLGIVALCSHNSILDALTAAPIASVNLWRSFGRATCVFALT